MENTALPPPILTDLAFYPLGKNLLGLTNQNPMHFTFYFFLLHLLKVLTKFTVGYQAGCRDVQVKPSGS